MCLKVSSFFSINTHRFFHLFLTNCNRSTGFIVCLPKKEVKNKLLMIYMDQINIPRQGTINYFLIYQIYHVYKCLLLINIYRCRRDLLIHTFHVKNYIGSSWCALQHCCSNMDMFCIRRKWFLFYLLSYHIINMNWVCIQYCEYNLCNNTHKLLSLPCMRDTGVSSFVPKLNLDL